MRGAQWQKCVFLFLFVTEEILVMSPGVTGKSERAGHNSVALPTAAGRREGDRICPALTDFPVTPGDVHSTAVLGSSGLHGLFLIRGRG